MVDRREPRPPLPPPYSVTEAARLMGISGRYAYKLIEQGRFPVPTIPVGSFVRVPRKPLHAFLWLDEGSGDDEAPEHDGRRKRPSLAREAAHEVAEVLLRHGWTAPPGDEG